MVDVKQLDLFADVASQKSSYVPHPDDQLENPKLVWSDSSHRYIRRRTEGEKLLFLLNRELAFRSHHRNCRAIGRSLSARFEKYDWLSQH